MAGNDVVVVVVRFSGGWRSGENDVVVVVVRFSGGWRSGENDEGLVMRITFLMNIQDVDNYDGNGDDGGGDGDHNRITG